MKQTKKAFTLIELLVVITIIALLVSILMPALTKAKEQATMAVCLSGQKQLLVSYTMYATDHNDDMVRPWTQDGVKGDWVSDPINDAGVVQTATNCTPLDEQNGIMTGALYKYYKDPELVHCPGDKRSFNEPMFQNAQGFGGWRSYSIVGTLNNRDGAGNDVTEYAGARIVKKLSKIKMPQEKYVFIEEGDHRGLNMDEWLIDFSQTTYNALTDSIGIFHNKKGTFSYADGHADVHAWQVKETIDWFTKYLNEKTASGIPNWTSPVSPNEDVKWLIDHAAKGDD